MAMDKSEQNAESLGIESATDLLDRALALESESWLTRYPKPSDDWVEDPDPVVGRDQA